MNNEADVIAGVGLGVLGLIDAIEPTQYLMSPSNTPAGATPGPWWCFGCYQMPQQSTPSVGPQSSGAAGGGFLLYPNKANTNMMQSVYSK